jgi:hypothetical protein
MTNRRAKPAWMLLPAIFAAGPACGGSGTPSNQLGDGSGDGGGGSFGEDATVPGALQAHVEDNHVAVKIITLGCSGDCATVQAVATGGNPPYTFAWEDGSTNAQREVCPTASTNYRVKVADTGSTGEIARAPETVEVPLTADVLSCPDGGEALCEEGGPMASFASGRYVGTVYCPPDGGVVSFPSLDGGGTVTGTLTMDLTVSGASVTGDLYFQWVPIGAIAGQGGLAGTVDCSTGVVASWTDGVWGLPGPTASDGGMTVLATGTVTGKVTVSSVPGMPGTIHGDFDYVSAPANVSATCQGTFTATLQP